MEGGLKPWKTQTVINNSPTLESYSKPLPPPPDGYYWEKLADGNWRLLHHNGLSLESRANATLTLPIEHIVMDKDTLPGICLRYGVSVVDVRRLNNFSGNAFRSKKVLQIPIQSGVAVPVQDMTPDVILQKFRNDTNETLEESRFYLSENNWNLEKALSAWKNDDVWTRTHNTESISRDFSKHIPSPTLVVPLSVEMASATVIHQTSGEMTNHNIVLASEVVSAEDVDEVTPLLPSSAVVVSAVSSFFRERRIGLMGN